MSGLTERQTEVLEFIRAFSEGNGYAPSVRELSIQFEISLNAVQCHLEALEKKGAIHRTNGVARSIVVQ